MPVEALLRPRAAITTAQPQRGFISVHPRYRHWLAKCGLTTPEAFLEWPGEIVSGHPDRHVLRVELPSGRHPRVVWMKREHQVSWKVRRRNRRAGFGAVSRSEREAKTLEHLDSQGLPGPQWIAYGEDGRGRAFLLVDDLAGFEELRVLAKGETDFAIRKEIVFSLGCTLADVHAAMVSTPDLAAKHIFLRPESASMTLVDWPSAAIGEAVNFDDRVSALAQLDASLHESLASPRERLRLLRAYVCRSNIATPLRDWASRIRAKSLTLRNQASIREQRLPPGSRQRLVWLAGEEEVCVIPVLAEHWPSPAVCAPYYPTANEQIPDDESCVIDAPDGTPATLVRWRSFIPFQRFWSLLRGRRWRSPATKLARDLFSCERVGIPGPRLLAFGQRFTSWHMADSFVLMRKGDEC